MFWNLPESTRILQKVTETSKMLSSLQKQNILKKKKHAQLVQKLICTKPMFQN